MKKIFILLVAGLMFICCNSTNNIANQIIEQNRMYNVYKIEDINSFYVIYCQKEEQKYKIISKKENNIPKGDKEKIVLNNVYPFELKKCDFDDENNSPLTNTETTSYILRCYMFDDLTKICEEKGINGLFVANNVKDLYFIE